MPSVQLRSFGGLNSDSHVQDIRNGDYTDAKNIEHISAEQGESLAITPRTGNKYSFDIGSISASNKVFRITFFLADINNLKIRVLHPNGVTPLKNNLNNLIITDALDFQNEIQTAFTNAGYSITVSLETQDTEKLVYILTADPTDQKLRYYDYIIQSIGDSEILVEVIQEAISTSREGSLEIIGSTDLLGDLFIISSTKRNEPIDYTIDTTVISPIGGLIVFNLTASNLDNSLPNYGFEQGQEIYVTGITGSNFLGQQASVANGLYIVYDFILDANTGIFSVFVLNQYPGLTIGNPIFGTGGMMKLNPFGFGQIGVAVKNESSDVWTYTSLLSSKNLNLWVKYRCDVQSEISGGRKSIYFTDNFNQPKVFYYNSKQQYESNGSITAINKNGYYTYGSISEQTNHISGPSSLEILFISQSEGGALPAGNIRYYARGVYADNSKTDWSLPSRLVTVYDSSTNIPFRIKGDIPGVVTKKQNTMRITGINPQLYKSIEVAAIQYGEIGIITTEPFGIIGTYEVNGNRDFIDFNHTGNEFGIELIPEELSIQSIVYQTAKNNCIVDNRYILSNLKQNNFDFSEINALFTYSLEKKAISRSIFNPNNGGTLTYGGYQDPNNVFYFTGYTLNETYRIGARYVLKNGYSSDINYLFDIDIDTQSVSSDGKRIDGLSNFDLVSKGTGLNGQDENLVPYIRIYLPQLNTITLNGLIASDIIDKIEIFRVELTPENRKIKASGFSIGIGQSGYIIPCTQPNYSIDFSKQPSNIGGLNCLYENPHVSNTGIPLTFDSVFCYSFYSADDLLNNNEESSKTAISSGDTLINYGQGDTFNQYIDRTNCFLQYDPVNLLQKEEVAVFDSSVCGENDLITITGEDIQGSSFTLSVSKRYANAVQGVNQQLQVIQTTLPTLGTSINILNNLFSFQSKNYTFKYNGVNVSSFSIGSFQSKSNSDFITEFNNNSNGDIIAQGLGADDIKFTLYAPYASGQYFYFIEDNDPFQRDIGQFPGGSSQTSSIIFSDIYAFNKSSIVSLRIDNIANPSGLKSYAQGVQRGLRFTQIKRNIPISLQYPDGQILNYVYTGSYFNQSNYSSGYIDVFGGDAMTITAFTRLTRRIVDIPSSVQNTAYNNNQAIYITLQSNANNHLSNNSDDNNIFPSSYDLFENKTFAWIAANNLDVNPYNNGYSITDLSYGYRANEPFDENKNQEYSTRIIYSDLKPQGSKTDTYRNFGLASYFDLDSTFGEIVDMKNVNGELFTLQPNKYQKQFFNARGTLQFSDASQIVLGDSSVLSRPGITLSSYGCSNKWTVILGKSQGGNDTLYWYDKIRKKFVRFGADGTVPLSDRASTRTISSDGLKWLLDYDSATLDYGMHGTWNSRLGEAIWTLRSYREPDIKYVYDPDNVFNYKPGQIVYNPLEQNHINFEETIVLYVVTVEHSSSLNIVPGLTPGWENYYFRPSIDDPNYYSIRTISFSEYKNRFNQFQESYHPRIYLPWKDTFLSPRPKNPFSLVYEHNAGEILRWYDYNGDIQEEEGFIEVVFNIDPNITKRYVALICNSEISPYRLELQTRTQSTVINGPEFEQQLEQFFAPIPNVAINGQTTLDNDFMYGQWVKIIFYYQPGVFQRLTNIVLKFNPMVRLWNT